MNEPAGKDADRRGLNPKLKPVENTSRDTETPTRPPSDSASVQQEEGRAWPMVWAVVVIAGVLIALWLLL